MSVPFHVSSVKRGASHNPVISSQFPLGFAITSPCDMHVSAEVLSASFGKSFVRSGDIATPPGLSCADRSLLAHNNQLIAGGDCQRGAEGGEGKEKGGVASLPSSGSRSTGETRRGSRAPGSSGWRRLSVGRSRGGWGGTSHR